MEVAGYTPVYGQLGLYALAAQVAVYALLAWLLLRLALGPMTWFSGWRQPLVRALLLALVVGVMVIPVNFWHSRLWPGMPLLFWMVNASYIDGMLAAGFLPEQCRELIPTGRYRAIALLAAGWAAAIFIVLVAARRWEWQRRLPLGMRVVRLTIIAGVAVANLWSLPFYFATSEFPGMRATEHFPCGAEVTAWSEGGNIVSWLPRTFWMQVRGGGFRQPRTLMFGGGYSIRRQAFADGDYAVIERYAATDVVGWQPTLSLTFVAAREGRLRTIALPQVRLELVQQIRHVPAVAPHYGMVYQYAVLSVERPADGNEGMLVFNRMGRVVGAIAFPYGHGLPGWCLQAYDEQDNTLTLSTWNQTFAQSFSCRLADWPAAQAVNFDEWERAEARERNLR